MLDDRDHDVLRDYYPPAPTCSHRGTTTVLLRLSDRL